MNTVNKKLISELAFLTAYTLVKAESFARAAQLLQKIQNRCLQEGDAELAKFVAASAKMCGPLQEGGEPVMGYLSRLPEPGGEFGVLMAALGIGLADAENEVSPYSPALREAVQAKAQDIISGMKEKVDAEENNVIPLTSFGGKEIN